MSRQVAKVVGCSIPKGASLRVTCKIEVRLKPGSKHNSYSANDDGTYDIKVTSRPIEGKANEHLIKTLSDIIGIPKSSIDICIGAKSRNKVVEISGLDKDQVRARFTEKSD